MIALLIAAAAATAAPTDKTDWVYAGHGSVSCGKWTADQKAGGATALAEKAWVMGFLGGVALYEKRNLFDGTDPQGAMAWIDLYCAANPLDQLAAAAYGVAGKLGARSLP